MTPRTPSCRIVHSCSGHVGIPTRYSRHTESCDSQFADSTNVCFGQASIPVSAFGNLIGQVIQLSSQKQVLGIDTIPDIARMKNKQVRGDGTNKQLPCSTVSILIESFESKLSVSVLLNTSCPKPTGLCFVDTAQEFFNCGAHTTMVPRPHRQTA
jgi:hypothetical protein